MANPSAASADVISQLLSAKASLKASPAAKALVEGLNHLTERLCQKAQVPSTDIYLMTVVGNTVMLHLAGSERTEHRQRPLSQSSLNSWNWRPGAGHRYQPLGEWYFPSVSGMWGRTLSRTC